MKILVCITGSSAAELGFDLLQNLEKINNIKSFAILSKGAKISFGAENHIDKNQVLNFCKNKYDLNKTIFFDDDDLAAPCSSGSFRIDQSIIAPCSINTLAKIKIGICDTLITRSAAVAIKEQKKLILAIREMPLSTMVLKNMYKLSKIGAIIAPPIFASYAAKNINEAKMFIIGKWLDLMNIKHDLYQRWNNKIS